MKALTLKEQAYLEIRKLILSGELKAGTFLTERELTEMLGMSRTPIRSALEKLEAEGIISNAPNKGPMVTEISLSRALEIFDLRMALESHVARRLSGSNITSKDLEDLSDNLDEQKRAIEKNEYILFTKLDTVFHKKLVSLYQNTEMMKAFERIQSQYTMLAYKIFEAKSHDLTHFYEDHRKIVELLLNNQSVECAYLIIKHIEKGRSFYFNPSRMY